MVLYEKIDTHIAKVTLNRPERHNAVLVPDGAREIHRKLSMGYDDDEVKVIILTGVGQSFCSGDDLRRTPFEAAGGGRRQRGAPKCCTPASPP